MSNTELKDSEIYFMKNYFPALLVLIFLLMLTTLFPPYNWGNERLRTKEERNIYISGFGYLNDILPIKEYDFLLSNSKKEIFIGWGFYQNKSTHKYLILERHLMTGELILNYIFCVLFATIFFLFRKKLETLYKNKKVLTIIIISAAAIIGSFLLFKFLNHTSYIEEIVSPKTSEGLIYKSYKPGSYYREPGSYYREHGSYNREHGSYNRGSIYK